MLSSFSDIFSALFSNYAFLSLFNKGTNNIIILFPFLIKLQQIHI